MSDQPFNKETLEQAILSLRVEGGNPRYMLLSEWGAKAIALFNEAFLDGWNWRRLKRELRRMDRPGQRKPYHKRRRA